MGGGRHLEGVRFRVSVIVQFILVNVLQLGIRFFFGGGGGGGGGWNNVPLGQCGPYVSVTSTEAAKGLMLISGAL